MDHDSDFAKRYLSIQQRIHSACLDAKRPDHSVKLVGVSKFHSVEDIRRAYDAGLRCFGENYVQDWRDKAKVLPDDIEWHFIGHLQANKARFLADGPVSCVQTMSTEKAAKVLARRCEAAQRSMPLDVMIEVNVGEEEAKSGVEEGELQTMVHAIDDLPALRLVGLMAIPPWGLGDAVAPYFQRLAELRELLNSERLPSKHLSELSMGMSDDFELAIAYGATIVRVGTSLFGPRPRS